jgi:hypothetical protein
MSASLIAVSATNSMHGAGRPRLRGPSSWSPWWSRASSGTGLSESITVIGTSRCVGAAIA